MIRLAKPTFDADEIAAVTAVLQSGNLVQGERVAAFEEAVAARIGVKYAAACSSGTAALHLAMMALELGPEDEVIVPSFTFPATANVVEMVGARVCIVDVDPITFNVTPEAVEAAITPRTRAILPVHLFGLAAPIEALAPLARRHGIPLIEDAACALGAAHPDGQGGTRLAGTVGHMACWSFHPRKVITTGEGGMVTTNDPDVALRLQELRSHGATRLPGRLEYRRPGPNYRLTEMQGALGVTQMERLDAFIAARRGLARAYDANLAGLEGVRRPVEPPGYLHIYQAYVITLAPDIDRERLMTGLRARGVECSIGTYALHAQPLYQARYHLDAAAFPGAETAFHHTVALPLHPGMSVADVETVAAALRAELAP